MGSLAQQLLDEIRREKEEKIRQQDTRLRELDAEIQKKDILLQELDAEIQKKDILLQEKDKQILYLMALNVRTLMAQKSITMEEAIDEVQKVVTVPYDRSALIAML